LQKLETPIFVLGIESIDAKVRDLALYIGGTREPENRRCIYYVFLGL
jgi:hypothetical protein